MTRARASARLAGLVVVAASVVACSGGGGGIQQAGNGSAPSPSPSGGASGASSPVTTQPRDLGSLPSCPVDALAASGTGDPVTITMWHALSAQNGRVLQQLADEYNASQDRVRVALEFQGGYEQSLDKYVQSDPANRPDLVQLPEYAVQLMIDTESVVPMQACVEAAGYPLDDFLARTVAAYTTEGVQWAMPFNVSNPVLFYNKRAFEDAGLDPDLPPVTFDDLDRISTKLRESGAAGSGLALDSHFDGGGGWFIEQWLAKAGALYADNDNGRLAPATRVLYDGADGVELLTFLQDQVQKGNAIYVGDNPSESDTLLKLADRDDPAAMTIASSASLGPVLAFVNGGLIRGVTGDDIGVGPMPGPPGAAGALVGGNALWIAAGKGDQRTAAAWDFISYLAGAQSQSTIAAGTGYVPVRSDALTLDPIKSVYADDPRFAVAYEQLLAAADAPSSIGPVLGPLREVRVVTATAVGRILEGADPQQALTEAAAEANALIADYARRMS